MSTFATGLTVSSSSTTKQNLSPGQKIMVAMAAEAHEPAAPNKDLVMMERIEAGYKQWDFGYYARLDDADALTEGTELTTFDKLVRVPVSVTPTEHGQLVKISKRAIRRQSDMRLVGVAGTMLGNGIARRQDKDIIALFTGLSKKEPGSNNALTIDHLRNIIAYLMTDNTNEYGPAMVPFFSSLHAEQLSDIIDDLTERGSDARPAGFGDRLVENWWRGRDRVWGGQLFHSGNIARKTVNTHDNTAQGACFSRSAFAMVMEGDVEATEDDTPKGLRAWEYGIFQSWGEAEVVDVHGVMVESDATTGVS